MYGYITRMNTLTTVQLLSIIIPVYNEESNIPLIYAELKRTLQNLENIKAEIIFVNDGSVDKSGSIIESLVEQDESVKYIEFSRNFGKEFATTAGLRNCNGDAAIVIDADLQHPVELISDFVEKWRAGSDMVIGVRNKNSGKGIVKNFSSYLFYYLINFVGETKIKNGATDFRIIDRKVINEFNSFTEHNRITRGLLDWLGFKKEYIYFNAQPRKNGKASYSSRKLFKLALSSFVSHSLFPLKFAGYLGTFIILISGPLGLYIFVDRYLLQDPFGFNFSGTAVLAVLNMFLVGVVLSCLGLIAIYIGSIQYEVMNRPIYVIRQKKNF